MNSLPATVVPRLRLPLRRRFVLQDSEASFEVRGFSASDPALRERLEGIGATFIRGYNCALLSDDLRDTVRLVETEQAELAGFAAEGAAMGAAIADALGFGGRKLSAWLAYAHERFTYLAHVGAGWALARVPWRRRPIARLLDPVHHWLAQDGLGFSDAFFRSAAVLGGWRRVTSGYAARAYDQGVGRGLWFVFGGDARAADGWIDRAPGRRQLDLWSGLGLAMAYAGGAKADELRDLARRTPRERACLAQGAAFAAEAHARAGRIPDSCTLALGILAERAAEEVVSTVRRERAAVEAAAEGALPRYERWRLAVQRTLGGGDA